MNVADKDQCVNNKNSPLKLYNEGKIHILANCVAYFGSKRITAGKKDWDKTFSVNNDVVDYSQACHPFMKEMEVADKIHCAAKSYIGCILPLLVKVLLWL